ncbi:MAG TPA: oligosaccharide flippase family protein, partial [Tenuifilaceae bacterium]|nr:oligosaccharide flippase family protein [Tenuifilaceae bacterium]
MKNRFLAIFRKSEILQNASILVSGTILAQAIPILLQPFLRRYFSPHDFGVYSVYSSLIGILLVISSFRYEQAIVLPKRNRDASVLVTSSILFSLVLLLSSSQPFTS